MTIAMERRLMTVDEFMALPNSRNYELINGNLVERKDMGSRAGYIAGEIHADLAIYNRQHKTGWAFNAETVYQCFGSRHTGRKMDVSFVRRGRLPSERIPEGHMTIAPDLAVEVVSPNDLAYEVDDKVALYQAAGVTLIWLVYPETRSIQVVHLDGSWNRLTAEQEITGGSVLPGFTARVGNFFPPPENVETAGEAVT